MRDVTREESESVNRYIESISYETGLSIGEKKFTMKQVDESRHKGKRIYGIKKGYCDLQECCDHCNKKMRFWCKVIRYIEDYQTKIIKRICN